MIDLLVFGNKMNYYIEDATDNAAGNTKFDSTTSQEYVVPTGKRWLLLGGVTYRDQAATLLIQARDASDKTIRRLASQGAGTGVYNYPDNQVGGIDCPIPLILDAGEQVLITFGAAQDTAAYASCMVIEVEML